VSPSPLSLGAAVPSPAPRMRPIRQ
jgi:hypothetical protein